MRHKGPKWHEELRCSECNKLLDGWVQWSDGRICSSSGFMVFEPLPVCDDCIAGDSKFQSQHANWLLSTQLAEKRDDVLWKKLQAGYEERKARKVTDD